MSSDHSGTNDYSLTKSSSKTSSIHLQHTHHPIIPPILHVKSKFDTEFRRFSCHLNPESPMTYAEFRDLVAHKHMLKEVPFTLCYTSTVGDLLPITNNENFHKAFESATPTLRILVQRKGESWEEKYGYGTGTIDRKRKGFSILMPASNKPQRRNYNISNPEDFRQVSAIIDVHIVPETHRRVQLRKHGSDRPLGFYIRPGSSVRMTPQGAVKTEGFFISRLLNGGLAESTGLIGVNDEIIEVNQIDVQGKTVDQVTDMMIANAANLVVTIIPANQRNTLQRTSGNRLNHSGDEPLHYASSTVANSNGRVVVDDDSDSDEDSDEIIHHNNSKYQIIIFSSSSNVDSAQTHNHNKNFCFRNRALLLTVHFHIWPYRNLINFAYKSRPSASLVVKSYIRQRHFPSWTSFFLPYKYVQDDLFGEKHINLEVDGHNYHVLRIGCYPFVKYHCTQRPKQDLNFENQLYKAITVCNLGIPCLLYGVAAIFLIRHTEHLKIKNKEIPIHFLIKEDHN
ncbi:hypothetical protein M3Y98_00525700 [Aphelenchoides besseyi]|nr:hypothetical protein M3Y98_00525700 [Aphelenchoides besseyi]